MDSPPVQPGPPEFHLKTSRQPMLWAAVAYAEAEHPTASLLKVGHHGSANATTPELVESAKPEFAIVSVGLGNSFGLPRNETLARLGDSGVRIYRTDLDGAVTFYLDGHSVTPSPAGLQ